MQSYTERDVPKSSNLKHNIEYKPIYSKFIKSITSSNSEYKSKLNEKHSKIFFFDTTGEKNNYPVVVKNNCGPISSGTTSETINHQSDSVIIDLEDEDTNSEVSTVDLSDYDDYDSSLDTDSYLYGKHDDIFFIDVVGDRNNKFEKEENKSKYELPEQNIEEKLKVDPDSVVVIEDGQTEVLAGNSKSQNSDMENRAVFDSMLNQHKMVNKSNIMDASNSTSDSKYLKRNEEVECELKTNIIGSENEVPKENNTVKITESIELPADDLERDKVERALQIFRDKDVTTILKILSSYTAIVNGGGSSKDTHCNCCKATNIRIINESRSNQTPAINVEIDQSFIFGNDHNSSSVLKGDGFQQFIDYLRKYCEQSRKADEAEENEFQKKDSECIIGKKSKKKRSSNEEKQSSFDMVEAKFFKRQKSSKSSTKSQCDDHSREKPSNDQPSDLNKNTDTSRDRLDSTMDSEGYEEDVLTTGRLRINLPFPVHPLHETFTRPSRPKREELEAIKAANYEIKTGMFTAEEDKTIWCNWERFCKDHNLIVDPFYFCEFPKFMNTDERIKFMQYMAHGLDNRLLHSVYGRFQKLFRSPWLKSGRFTQDEDKMILDVYGISRKPVRKLAKLLNRDRKSVEKRYMTLMRNKNKVMWDIEMVDKFVNRLMKAAKTKNINDLKDIKLPTEKWVKISKKMDIPIDKLRRAWKVRIHPRLFSQKAVNILEIKKSIINTLSERNETDWRSLDWKAIAKEYDGFTAQKIYLLFRQTVEFHVPKAYHKDLKHCLILLKQKIEEGDTLHTTHKFERYVYEDGHVRLESP